MTEQCEERSMLQHMGDGIRPAWRRTAETLFSPFRPRRWLLLALMLLFSQFVGGGGAFCPVGTGVNWESLPPARDSAAAAFFGSPQTAVPAAVSVFILWLFLLYLACRFKFALFFSLARQPVSLVRWWRPAGRGGGEYFLFSLALALTVLLLLAPPAAGLIYLALRKAGAVLIGGFCIFYVCFFLVMLAAGLLNLTVSNLVIPAMVQCREPVAFWTLLRLSVKRLLRKKTDPLVFCIALFVLEMAVQTLSVLLLLLPSLAVNFFVLTPLLSLLLQADSIASFAVFLLLSALFMALLFFLSVLFCAPLAVFKTFFCLELAERLHLCGRTKEVEGTNSSEKGF